MFGVGEPVGWRLDLLNLDGDSIGLHPGSLVNDVAFYLTGPRGGISRQILTISVLGWPTYIRTGDRRPLFSNAFEHFVFDSSPGRYVLPLLEPGPYTLHARFDGVLLRGNLSIRAQASASAPFRIVAPTQLYSDSLRSAVDTLLHLVSLVDSDSMTAPAAAAILEQLMTNASTPMWFGTALYHVGALLRCCTATVSAPLDSTLTRTAATFIRRHPERAFAMGMMPSDTTARNTICRALAALGTMPENAHIACTYLTSRSNVLGAALKEGSHVRRD